MENDGMGNETLSNPIGVFDSGVGGLSILKELRNKLPGEDLLYIADQAHVPYGMRSKREVLDFSMEIVRFLLDEGSKMIIVACNTASAAALSELRNQFPEISFVGMEPAIKPAAEQSQSGVVGVLATPSTFEGDLYASVVARFSKGARILKHTCPGLVEEIEAGRENGLRARKILEMALIPMLEKGLDSIVLGCTHYPFSRQTIREIVGKEIDIYDPAPAIAHRAHFLLNEIELLIDGKQGAMRLFTSGETSAFREFSISKLGETAPTLEKLFWKDGVIAEAH